MLFLLPLLFSCTNDAYDTGDTRYSYLRTDFVEAVTDGNAHLVSATTDDGVKLTFSKAMTASWATVADTTYRAMLYYNLSSSSAYPVAATQDLSVSTTVPNLSTFNLTVEPLAAAFVYVLTPTVVGDDATSDPANHKSQTSNLKSQFETDPVELQSLWMSANGGYLNLSLALMTGQPDSIGAQQLIGIVCDSSEVRRNGTHTFYYTFTHSQGGVPQYYKSTVYVSIPTKKMTTGDCIRLSLNTYNGWVTREIVL